MSKSSIRIYFVFISKLNKNQMTFNRKLIGLRDKKKEIVDEINRNIDRLEQIQYLTGTVNNKQFEKMSLRLEEMPEKYVNHLILK
jgi:hypothetical protein